MRLAWFKPAPADESPLSDDTAEIIVELGHTHEIEVVTESTAAGFPATHARHPFDLQVYQLPPQPWRSFMTSYQALYPGLSVSAVERPIGWGTDSGRPPAATARNATHPIRAGVVGAAAWEVALSATARARDLGHRIDLFTADPLDVVQRADIVLALSSPHLGDSLVPALAAMAAAKPVVTFEVEATAAWPAFDPQTWQARGPSPSEDPAVVSIDLRDREHSLLLALRRLEADAPFRNRLALGGFNWWRTHATVQHAAAKWQRLITKAAGGTQPAAGG